MNWEAYLASWIAEAPALAGSVVAVTVMVLFALLLGFRRTAELDEAALERLAEAEGASVEAALLAPDARAAFAKLSGGKVMIARVMGNDISARIAPQTAAAVRVAQDKLSVRFADTGFPPLHMRLQQTPPWLAQLAGDAK